MRKSNENWVIAEQIDAIVLALRIVSAQLKSLDRQSLPQNLTGKKPATVKLLETIWFESNDNIRDLLKFLANSPGPVHQPLLEKAMGKNGIAMRGVLQGLGRIQTNNGLTKGSGRPPIIQTSGSYRKNRFYAITAGYINTILRLSNS